MSGVTSPSPADEEPKQTPDELTQGPVAQAADSGRDEPEAVATDEPQAEDGETAATAGDSVTAEASAVPDPADSEPAVPEAAVSEPEASPTPASPDTAEAVAEETTPHSSSTGSTAADPTPDDQEPDLPDADELGGLLRERLFQAVSGIEPRPGTLE